MKALGRLPKWLWRKKAKEAAEANEVTEEKKVTPRSVRDLLKVRPVKKDDEDVFIICMGDMMVDEQPYETYEDAQYQIDNTNYEIVFNICVHVFNRLMELQNKKFEED